jgi:peptide/nickel transport system substrate-binding protein
VRKDWLVKISRHLNMRTAVARLTLLVGLVASACTATPTASPPQAAPTAGAAATTAPAAPAPATTAPAAAKPTSPPAATAPAATPPAAAPARGGQITIAVRREAGELDIHKPSIGTTRQYARALYNALFAVSVDGTVSGELVERWDTPDPRTYILHLRPGVTFHDGTPFNADAVKFNFDRIRDPAEKAFYRTQLDGIDAYEVVDPLTVKLSLAAPDGTLPARLSDGAGWMVSPAGVQKWGADFATHPVGTGPFEFVEWVKDDHLTLKRFDNYWEKDAQGQQLPYLDGLTFKPLTDLTVMLTGLRTGSLDIIEAILPSDLATVRADPNLRVVEGPGNLQVLWLNNSKPPFDTKALRQAVSWGFDRDGIEKALYFGTGTPGQYLLPPGNWAFNPQGSFYNLDVAQAKAKLAEGGQPNGFSFQALANNVTNDLQLAQAVQGQLANLGIKMDIVPLESAVNADRRLSGDFQASFSNLTPTTDPDQYMYSYVRTGQGVNRARYSNPKVDDLLDRARQSTDQAVRKALYVEAQQYILDDAPMAYTHLDADLKGVRSRVVGMAPSIDGFVRVNKLSVQK